MIRFSLHIKCWYRTMTLLCIITLSSMETNFIVALNSSSTTDGGIFANVPVINLNVCTLNCENNGICQYMNGTVDELQSRIQSGLMIMYCICPEQYTGMGCEQVRTSCNIQTMKCPNTNTPCEYDMTKQSYHCDCALADSISSTTSRFCRNTYTEYCTPPQIDINNSVLSFCTNGGKCKADVIAAQIAPYNTTINANYKNAGCICPSEYYGPHCEFMYQTKQNNNNNIPNENIATISPTIEESNTESQTFEPTTDVDLPSIEEMIDEYTNQTKLIQNEQTNTNSNNRSNRQIMRIVVCSIFVSLGIVCFILTIRSYRKKRCRLILLHKENIETDIIDNGNNNNNKAYPMYRAPISITGSTSSNSVSSTSSMKRTFKIGTKKWNNDVQYIDDDCDNSNPTLQIQNLTKSLSTSSSKKKKKSIRNKQNQISQSNRLHVDTDEEDTDIVSVSNELSFHRRCYPLTPFVVEDDDNENNDDNDHDEEENLGLNTKRQSNQRMNRNQHGIPMTARQSNDTIQQSWIVSLSNRAINFTEIVQQQQRQPGYSHHPIILQPPITNDTSNGIYLVDDDQDEDDDRTTFFDSYVDL